MTTFHVLGTDEQIHVEDFAVVIGGYTARDQHTVQKHIDELAEIGVPAPEKTPMFYSMPSDLVTTAPTINVSSTNTSGEVEPVYIRHAGKHYLGIGSDHTDRELEAKSIAEAKEVCPKPVGIEVLPVGSIQDLSLAGYRASCYADGVLYQQGDLGSLLDPAEVLAQMEEELHLGDQDYICFGGTMPLLTGNLIYANRWTLAIEPKENQDLALSHEYTVA